MKARTAPFDRLPEPTLVDLGPRGTTAIWDSGPVSEAGDEVPLVLLHGWNVNSFVNFGSAYKSLAKEHRIILIDLHGHGRGPRSAERFTIEASVQDVIKALDFLEVERAIFVGYSMGGLVAQLLARQAPERVSGIVLAATAALFCAKDKIRWLQTRGLAASTAVVARLPERARHFLFLQITAVACARYPRWVRDEVREADPVSLLSAGVALLSFDSRDWIGDVETPKVVIVTTEDRVVAPVQQRQLAVRSNAETILPIDADHDLPIRNDPRFARILLTAVEALDRTSTTDVSPG